MGTVASQISSLTIVYSTVYSDADKRKHQSSASLAFVRGIHRGPVNSPHKRPATRKMFPFDDIMKFNLNQNTFFFQKYSFENIASKMLAFCLGSNVLKQTGVTIIYHVNPSIGIQGDRPINTYRGVVCAAFGGPFNTLAPGKCSTRQTSNISCTKSQNLNVSRLVLQLSVPIPLKPCG